MTTNIGRIAALLVVIDQTIGKAEAERLHKEHKAAHGVLYEWAESKADDIPKEANDE
jgi:hypothetical protein